MGQELAQVWLWFLGQELAQVWPCFCHQIPEILPWLLHCEDLGIPHGIHLGIWDSPSPQQLVPCPRARTGFNPPSGGWNWHPWGLSPAWGQRLCWENRTEAGSPSLGAPGAPGKQNWSWISFPGGCQVLQDVSEKTKLELDFLPSGVPGCPEQLLGWESFGVQPEHSAAGPGWGKRDHSQ